MKTRNGFVSKKMKILTEKKLKSYFAGKGCKCAAYGESECGCPNVDWTDKEVYELRLMVKKLEAEIKRYKRKLDEKEEKL